MPVGGYVYGYSILVNSPLMNLSSINIPSIPLPSSDKNAKILRYNNIAIEVEPVNYFLFPILEDYYLNII